jgi:acyl-[acyl-carrier-protein]-phospholipid O-acyltransferase/long-chain-fatty-acid--[acyl-carrier-protein] ligase
MLVGAAALLDAVAGLFLFCWTRIFFRVRVVSGDRLPTSGPVILAVNATSLIDRAVLHSALPRRGRFFAQSLRWLPIIGELWRARTSRLPEAPYQPADAHRQADALLKRGGALLVYPEGRVSRVGQLLPVTAEFEELARRHPDIPIVPVYMTGTWPSIFSFRKGRFWTDGFTWKPLKVTIVIGQPLPRTDHLRRDLRNTLMELSTQAYEASRYDRLPLPRQMIYSTKRFGRQPGIADSKTPIMNYGTVFMRTVILSRLLGRRLDKSPCVGLYLPSSVGGALANYALSLMGRVPVNLNYTIGQEPLDSCVRQAGITQILSSKEFIHRVGMKPAGEIIYLEDLRNDLRTADKLFGLLARFLPGWIVDHFLLGLGKMSIDDTATIIFSSGTTGEPKGIVLTHHNVVSDTVQMVQHAVTDQNDVVLGILPFFHSFGFTVTMWVPPLIGCSCIFHFNPLEGEQISKLAKEHKFTMFFATSTFLRTYLRKCDPTDFQHLRTLVCGAEKLQPGIASEFEKKFGIFPNEGYGCSELSPVVTVNDNDFVEGDVRQEGGRRGTIGRPLGGIAVSIRDVDTFEPLPWGAEGLLFVKGPNVMKGYFNRPDMTADAIRDGWYNTGDIARLDDDGFVRITDRLARFSKIGGEMVPHAKIEERMHAILNTSDATVVVVGIPDQRKGERLVVVHRELTKTTDDLWNELKDSGVPSIWLPLRTDFVAVDELPILGTGKIDLKRIKKIAVERG